MESFFDEYDLKLIDKDKIHFKSPYKLTFFEPAVKNSVVRTKVVDENVTVWDLACHESAIMMVAKNIFFVVSFYKCYFIMLFYWEANFSFHWNS